MSSQAVAPSPRLVSIEAAPSYDLLGITVTPLVANAETAEHFGLFYAQVPPGAGIPVHSHPDVELFFVLEGELAIVRRVGTEPEQFTVGANKGGLIPINAPHGFLNTGAVTARVLLTCTKKLECFFLEAGRPLDEAQERTVPSPEEVQRVLEIARKWGQDFEIH